MKLPRTGVVMVAAVISWCACDSIDARIEAARKRVLALDAGEAARIVAFCHSWKHDGQLTVDQFPSALPVRPTSASADGHVITFSWWNNSHAEEDDPHPGFELICSEPAIPGAKPLAPGLWYRDAPMNDGG